MNTLGIILPIQPFFCTLYFYYSRALWLFPFFNSCPHPDHLMCIFIHFLMVFSGASPSFSYFALTSAGEHWSFSCHTVPLHHDPRQCKQVSPTAQTWSHQKLVPRQQCLWTYPLACYFRWSAEMPQRTLLHSIRYLLSICPTIITNQQVFVSFHTSLPLWIFLSLNWMLSVLCI